jgi:hypothetical protein
MFRNAIVLLAIVTLIYAQVTPICDTDASCNNWSTMQQQRCQVDTATPPDPLKSVCQARNQFQYLTTTVDPKGSCTNSINFGFGNTHVCGGYGVAGCTFGTYVGCVDGTFANIGTGKCETGNASTTVYVGLGQRCDLTGVTVPAIGCGNNLVCSNYICRQQLQLGDNCRSSPYQCGNGMVCDRDLCVIRNSKVAQDSCTSPQACVSGLCTDGVCQEMRSIPCFSNADCVSSGNSDGVCYFASSSALRGVCTAGQGYAAFRAANCAYGQCSAVSATVNKCTSCDTELVRSVCATQCINRPDLRKVSDGYIYNCQSLTRVLATGCQITTTVTNCPITPLSGAFSQALSLVVVIVAALMVIA